MTFQRCFPVYLLERPGQESRPLRMEKRDEDIYAHFRLPQLLKFREREFLELTGNFNRSNRIAKGCFSSVYRGVFPNGLVVAVKKLELTTREIRSMGQKCFFTELHVLAKISHRNILKILGYFSNVDTMALILAFMPRGSLSSRLHQRHNYICLDWNRRYKIALGVAQALTYLHHNCTQQIVHADLNPSNILLDDEFEAHIGNFGFAKTVEKQMKRKEGFTTCLLTPGYSAPELFSGEKPSPEADVYSFGIIILELLTRKSPTSVEFSDGLTLREWAHDALQKGSWTQVLDMQMQQEIISQAEMLSVMEMAISCCNENPTSRPSMQAVTRFLVRLKDHGNFAKFNKPLNVLIDQKPFAWVSAGKKKIKSNSDLRTQSRTTST